MVVEARDAVKDTQGMLSDKSDQTQNVSVAEIEKPSSGLM